MTDTVRGGQLFQFCRIPSAKPSRSDLRDSNNRTSLCSLFVLDQNPFPGYSLAHDLKRRRNGVLAKRLHEAWRAREAAIPISSVLRFMPEGLTLGAGTVLLATDAERRLHAIEGQEPRLLTLLSAACGARVSPSALGHIERAAKCWQRGEDALAAIHLAFSGIHLPQDEREAACRLFAADELMKSGASPRAILDGLDLEAPFVAAIDKFYNPLEPRILPGNPHPGEWTRLASPLGEMSAEQVTSLARFATRIVGIAGAATTVFGLLFIPSANKMIVEGDVPGLPRGRYAWNKDEGTLRLTYDGSNGQPQTVLAHGDVDRVLHDQHGTVIGRVLPDNTVVLDQRALPETQTKDNEPRLCPDPGWDKESAKKGWDYQEYVADFVNPGNPTGRGWGYELLHPTGKVVSYDDCQHTTGMMVDAKGPVYAKLLSDPRIAASVARKLWKQAVDQVAAAGPRKVRWYFAEPKAADFVEKYFSDVDKGAEKIEINKDLPWPEKKP